MSGSCKVRIAAGVVLIGVGLWGSWYCIRAVRSQILYHAIKFKQPDMALRETVKIAERAYRLYPYNYHMSRWVAEKAWYSNQNAEVAADWASRGVALNPWQRDLRWLDALLVGRSDPAEAARRWASYSDWAFWNPWMLAGRVYWYAVAGRVEDAEAYLPYLDGKGNFTWAEQALEAARLPAR